MFTGIIESLGEITRIIKKDGNASFWIKSDFYSEVKIDQSIAHNGVCLTVDELNPTEKEYRVTAVDETLNVTCIGYLEIGNRVNLERCMQMNGRLDGHIVQGHVDGTATCVNVQNLGGSYLFDFKLDIASKLMVEKGSICINGVSLTCFNVSDEGFTVTIIPYTFEHTNFKSIEVGSKVNIEFDIIGKYVARMFPKQ